jgi:arsenate reductase
MKPTFNVLFICIGNACRSQMADGFARTYGKDVLRSESAGLAPAYMVPEDTKTVMQEKGVDMKQARPKGLNELPHFKPDLVVNMSGEPFSAPGVEVLEWQVVDPYMGPLHLYRKIRDEIEQRVMSLVLTLRKRAAATPAAARRTH